MGTLCSIPGKPPLLVQVFGQRELESRLRQGGKVASHLISIVDPARFFEKRGEDQRIPQAFIPAFKRILRLSFADSQASNDSFFYRRAPRLSDALCVIRFVKRTAAEADGYTVHCWRGVARSSAVAFGILYLLRGSEEAAASELMSIRHIAYPHRELLAHFDTLLGSRLAEASGSLRDERLRAMRERIRDLAASRH